MKTTNTKSDIAVIGLAVMGENLARNIASRGYTVTVYNRSNEKTDRFMKEYGASGRFVPADSPDVLVETLSKPRKIILMIKAGTAVETMLETLFPLLEKGDILIDGGNSHFEDTQRRQQLCSKKGLHYIGCGISGGEEGALHGPSLMPGGDEEAWPEVKPILMDIAAQAPNGEKCCAWMGSGGAGHFVKMVHNGIEYGFMQIITEIYQILRDHFLLSPSAIAAFFSLANTQYLNSYLMEITSQILSYNEPDGIPLIDRIVDSAGQKGTGRWTVETALEEGVSLDIITEAVFFRALSADRELRAACRRNQPDKRKSQPVFSEANQDALKKALLAGKILAFSQGFTLIARKSASGHWNVPLDQVAKIWRGGCIIRSALLTPMGETFEKDPKTLSLIAAEPFRSLLAENLPKLQESVSQAIMAGIPVPALSAAVNYLTTLFGGKTGINLLQAQRDFFGAHTFERTDQPTGIYFHNDWISSS